MYDPIVDCEGYKVIKAQIRRSEGEVFLSDGPSAEILAEKGISKIIRYKAGKMEEIYL